jgi:uncharacterized protein YdaU (DUF1376 family)
MSAEGFHFNVKQWLGDDAVLLMDWDVRAMHLQLMCVAWQKTPPGTLPDDNTMLCKWLSCLDKQAWSERIRPQLAQAWRIADGRWHQDGLMREWERQASNSQKRRAAANIRWKKEPGNPFDEVEEKAGLLTADGEPASNADSGFSLTSLLKDSAAFRAEASAEEKTSIWTVGVKLLKHEGFPEDKVRSYLGKLIQEHGEKTVAEAVASLSLKPITPADAKSYLIGILRSESSKRRGRGRVAL